MKRREEEGEDRVMREKLLKGKIKENISKNRRKKFYSFEKTGWGNQHQMLAKGENSITE